MRLWNFFKGYVKIRVRCLRPEKTVNKFIENGVSMHDVRRISRSEITAVVSHRGLRLAEKTADDNGWQLDVMDEQGLPMIMKVLLHRPMLIATVLLGFAAMLYFSGRILRYDIEGADCVSEEDIIGILRSSGGGLYGKASGIDLHGISERLVDEIEEISFADVRRDGVVLKVIVHENEQKAYADEEGTPADIFAEKECIIERIVATKGKALVAAGQAVKAGTLLITGDITPEGFSERTLVRARGEVTARVMYRLVSKIDAVGKKKVRSGRECEYTAIDIFGRELASEVEFSSYESDLSEEYILLMIGVPIHVHGGKAYELVLAEAELTEDEQRERAMSELEKKLRSSVPDEARIISKTVSFVKSADGSLTALMVIETIEKIGVIKPR